MKEFVESLRAFEKRIREIVEDNFERVRDDLLKEACKPEDYPAIREQVGRYISPDKFVDETVAYILDTLDQLAMHGCTPSPNFDFRHDPDFEGLDIDSLTALETIYGMVFDRLLGIVAKELGVEIEMGVCLKVSEKDRQRLAEIVGVNKLSEVVRAISKRGK